MALSSDFINAVDSHDSMLTHIMLKDSMLVDLTLRQFEEELAYAEEKMPDLYDEHDGEAFPNDITMWNKQLMNDQMVKVVTNFSKERIEFLRKLVRNIYSQKAEQADKDAFIESHRTVDNSVQAGAGVAAIGAVVAVAGLATSHPVIAVAGVAVAAAGGVIVMKNKK